MQLTDSLLIAAPKARVFAALNDPEVLRACIPGCESLTQDAPNQFAARVVLKIGPVKAGFDGNVTLDPSGAPDRFTLTGEGKGGAAGFAKGGAVVTLTEEDGGTRLTYDATAEIGGKLAQLGSRLIQGTATKLAGKFFERFAEEVTATAA